MSTNSTSVQTVSRRPTRMAGCLETYACLFWVVLAVLDVAVILFFPAVVGFDMSFGGTVVYPMARWYSNHQDGYDVLILVAALALLPLVFAAAYTSPYEIADHTKSTFFGLGFGVAAACVMLPCIACLLVVSVANGTRRGFIRAEEASIRYESHRYHLVRFVEVYEFGLMGERGRGGGEYFYLCECDRRGWVCTCDRIPNSSDSTHQFIRAGDIQNAALLINPTDGQLEVHLDDYHYAVEPCDAAPSNVTACHAMYFRPFSIP